MAIMSVIGGKEWSQFKRQQKSVAFSIPVL
jgi:hypothetical protein